MSNQTRVLKTKHYTITDGPNQADLKSVPHGDRSPASICFHTDNDQEIYAKVSSCRYLDKAHSKVSLLGYTGYFQFQYWHALWPFSAEYDLEHHSGQLAISGNRIARTHPDEPTTLHDHT